MVDKIGIDTHEPQWMNSVRKGYQDRTIMFGATSMMPFVHATRFTDTQVFHVCSHTCQAYCDARDVTVGLRT